MIGKYRRYDMIGAINLYCIKNDLHITYIEKKTKSQLEEIIAQYNINVDEMLFEEAKQEEKLDSFAQNFVEGLQTEIKKNLDYFVGKIEMLESLLNDEQKEKYLEYCNSQNSTQL
jgi:hypothetical protein